jgi:hypothetical protein
VTIFQSNDNKECTKEKLQAWMCDKFSRLGKIKDEQSQASGKNKGRVLKACKQKMNHSGKSETIQGTGAR